MTIFNLDVVAHEDAREPWEFTAKGQKWRLPHVQDLTLGAQVAVDSGRPDLAVDAATKFDAKTGEWKPAKREAVAMIRAYHPDQLAAFTAAWLAYAGMEPGESEASSPS